MGYGHFYRCLDCSEMGTLYLDVGKLYPEFCWEMKQKAFSGKMGKRLAEVVRQRLEGAFDCTRIIFACDCGGWRVAPRMDYYTMDDSKGIVDLGNVYFSCAPDAGRR